MQLWRRCRKWEYYAACLTVTSGASRDSGGLLGRVQLVSGRTRACSYTTAMNPLTEVTGIAHAHLQSLQ